MMHLVSLPGAEVVSWVTFPFAFLLAVRDFVHHIAYDLDKHNVLETVFEFSELQFELDEAASSIFSVFNLLPHAIWLCVYWVLCLRQVVRVARARRRNARKYGVLLREKKTPSREEVWCAAERGTD